MSAAEVVKLDPLPMQFGALAVTLVPHHSDHIGTNVFMVLDASTDQHIVANLSPDSVRMFIARLKLALIEAEALAHKAQRRRA